eukprot:jgi/Botrbrau1/22831/Bobra.0132s0154.1
MKRPRWQAGVESLEVEDWERDGCLVRIDIPPLKTAAEHAASLYQTARRQRRGLSTLLPLVQEGPSCSHLCNSGLSCPLLAKSGLCCPLAAEAELEYLQEVEVQLSLLDPAEPGALAALKDMQEEMVAGKYLRPPSDAALAAKGAAKARKAAKRGGASGTPKNQFRRFTSPGGFEVWRILLLLPPPPPSSPPSPPPPPLSTLLLSRLPPLHLPLPPPLPLSLPLLPLILPLLLPFPLLLHLSTHFPGPFTRNVPWHFTKHFPCNSSSTSPGRSPSTSLGTSPSPHQASHQSRDLHSQRGGSGWRAAIAEASGGYEWEELGATCWWAETTGENDELSHKVGAANDLWFHARGCPGSHTILRIRPGRAPEEEDVQCAADLAAFYSKARNEGKAPVTQVLVRDLRKPPRAPPGMVLVAGRETVLMACPARSLEALLPTAET